MPDLYDSLYKLGYQSDGIMTHYSPVLKSLRALVAADPTVKRGLDVGSSHGGGVKAMWTMGLLASGVDVAPTAIALAGHGAIEPVRATVLDGDANDAPAVCRPRV